MTPTTSRRSSTEHAGALARRRADRRRRHRPRPGPRRGGEAAGGGGGRGAGHAVQRRAPLCPGAIRAAATIPFLDMVTLSAAQAASRAGPGGRVGILASPAVRLTKLFDAALARYGAEAIYPADQNAMLAAIRDIKRQGRAQSAIDTLAGAGRELASEGARVQLVACSEFSIVSDTLADELGVIDTLDALVAAIVRFAKREVETPSSGGAMGAAGQAAALGE